MRMSSFEQKHKIIITFKRFYLWFHTYIVLRKTFRQSPVSVRVRAGESVQLTCDPPIGVPTPVVKWEKDGQLFDLTTANDPYSFGGDGTSLFISEVQIEQTGSYVCAAENNAALRKTDAAVVSLYP